MSSPRAVLASVVLAFFREGGLIPTPGSAPLLEASRIARSEMELEGGVGGEGIGDSSKNPRL
jgi:hypothetical protein